MSVLPVRRALARAVLGLGLVMTTATCEPPTQTEEPTDECTTRRDCGAGADCVKGDDGLMHCVALGCSKDSDCNVEAGERCDVLRSVCVGCRPGLAGSCPAGQVCLGGLCSEQPPPPDDCEVAPQRVVIRSGASVTLAATGFMASGALAPLAAFTWTSGLETCVTVDSAGVATGVSGVDAKCTATVTAHAAGGSATCDAQVVNFPEVNLPALRAMVVEEFSGAPIQGARLLVRVDDGAGGAWDALPVASTDADGVATIADVGLSAGQESRLLDVSVFHDGYNYVTVVRPRSSDLLFAIREVKDDQKVAGIKGGFDFSGVHTEGDIKLGLGGLSFPGSIFDLNFDQLLGESVSRTIDVSGLPKFDDAELPSGLYMQIGSADIKADFQAFGEPGRRLAWGLGGRVRMGELGPIITDLTEGSDELDIGQILTSVLDYFGTFDHAVVGNLEVTKVARPQDGSEPQTWNYCPAGQSSCAANDVQLKIDKQLSQTATYNMPTLPQVPGGSGYIPAALVLLGSVVPGQGTVPLGLTAGMDAPDDNDPEDGVIDPGDCAESNPDCIQPPKGKVNVYFAPPHSGLEGTRYLTLAMALNLEDMDRVQYTSVIVEISDAVQETGNEFSAGSFLGFAEGAIYLQGASYVQDRAITGANIYRLNLDTNDREWHIYFDDPAEGVSLPTPDDIEDRVQNADIQAFKTVSGAIGVRELFEFNSSNMDDILDLTSAFTSIECVGLEQPEPAAGGCPDDYEADATVNLCVGGPDEITAFAAGTSNPCAALAGRQPVYVNGPDSEGICARTPSCWSQE